jgi:cell division protein FtsI/penicillin-binding protein 2
VVAQRRFGPLIVLVFIGFVVLIARTFQVQVLEHEVWAQQASSLTRSSKILPSHRGRFLDREGRELVRDEDVYQIEFRYRDFRRGHPLGIVAHARAAMEMRPVPLDEALANMDAWIESIVRITPKELDDFQSGKPVFFGEREFPEAAKPALDGRYRRAADLRFYIATLLALDANELKAIKRELGPAGRGYSYLDITARLRSIAPEVLLERVKRSASDACAELATLAELLDRQGTGAAADASARADDPRPALERLVALLELVRRDLEDDAADELFRLAAGFSAGDISTASLESTFDLDWIALTLRWDDARLTEWVRGRRGEREHSLQTSVLPRILAQTDLEGSDRMRAERLLDELALLYRPELDRKRDPAGHAPSWSELDTVVALPQIGRLFEGARLPRGFDASALVLPFQDAELRAVEHELADAEEAGQETVAEPWQLVGLLSDLAGGNESGMDNPLRAEAAAEFWSSMSESRFGLESEDALHELQRLVGALERRHAAACDRAFAALRGAQPARDGKPARFAFTDDRLTRAEQQEKYILIDRGNRPMRLFREPTYALVERIARHPDRYRGFDVRETTRRVQLVHDKYGITCANTLMGDVRKPALREMLSQSQDERRYNTLKFQLMRSADEEREIRDLAARLQRPDDWTGDSGLEDYFDPELRGRSGFFETESLEDRARGDSIPFAQAAQDGQDVVLTLDADVQIAFQEVLNHPEVPGGSDKTDVLWFENPVGAVVLITPYGDVIAAASAPDIDGMPPIPGRDHERALRRERTLQRPTFNPPGSVFKPFVAAYALDRLGFDPTREFTCHDLGNGRGGFEKMHCTGIHYNVSLHRALTVSCNAFFAQLGLVYTGEQFLDMTHVFGFDEPTGVKCFGSEGRSGLREDYAMLPRAKLLAALADRRTHMQFSNGLGKMEATPMQVARAMAGIATGTLPELRLARSVGGNEVPRRSRPLGISETNLVFVREAMRSVVDNDHGSAHNKGLDAHSLGFTFACKTGSGDYREFKDTPELLPQDRADMVAGKLRKHAWVAGFFPAESPKAILIVYLHDVSETSSKTATYLAAQFLRTEALKRWVAKACAEDAR